jgi:hypothetical protein
MSQNIGTNYPVVIPTLSDRASIVEAFEYYHKGGIAGSSSQNSIEFHLGEIESRIDSSDSSISSIDARVTNTENQLGLISGQYVKLIANSASANTIVPQVSTVVPITIQGVNNQSVNLQEWKINASTIRARVNNLGTIFSWDGSGSSEVVTLSGTQTLTNKSITSPSLTGTPTAPTASNSTNNTQIATTQFVKTAIGTVDINSRSSNYTAALSDVGKLIIFNGGSSLTVPTNSSVEFPVGSSFSVMQATSTTLSILASSGVTINYTPGNRLRTQWSVATLTKTGTDTWILFGDLMI